MARLQELTEFLNSQKSVKSCKGATGTTVRWQAALSWDIRERKVASGEQERDFVPSGLTNEEPMVRSTRSRRANIAIAIVVATVFVAFALEVIQKVVSGHGLDTYRSARLVEWTYLGALVTLAALAVAGCIGLLIRAFGLLDRWRLLREVRASKRRTRNA